MNRTNRIKGLERDSKPGRETIKDNKSKDDKKDDRKNDKKGERRAASPSKDRWKPGPETSKDGNNGEQRAVLSPSEDRWQMGDF
eukprot:4943841-Pyramimonas_sp.AAC.1